MIQLNNTMDSLNDDCLLAIFVYLDLDERIRSMRVCKRWHCLLSYQLERTKAIRLGYFGTKKLNPLRLHPTVSLMTCDSDININKFNRKSSQPIIKPSSIVNLFNKQLFQLPADLDTHCFRFNHYDYLHRCLTQCSHSLVALYLGHVLIDYRGLVSLVYNCSNVEHLELQSCATETSIKFDSHQSHAINGAPDNNQIGRAMEISVYDIKRCDLVRSKKWLNLNTLIINQCDALNETMIALLLALSDKSLKNLTISSHQYFTGESLLFCNPHLEKFQFKSCPSMTLTLSK